MYNVLTLTRAAIDDRESSRRKAVSLDAPLSVLLPWGRAIRHYRLPRPTRCFVHRQRDLRRRLGSKRWLAANALHLGIDRTSKQRTPWTLIPLTSFRCQGRTWPCLAQGFSCFNCTNRLDTWPRSRNPRLPWRLSRTLRRITLIHCAWSYVT